MGKGFTMKHSFFLEGGFILPNTSKEPTLLYLLRPHSFSCFILPLESLLTSRRMDYIELDFMEETVKIYEELEVYS